MDDIVAGRRGSPIILLKIAGVQPFAFLEYEKMASQCPNVTEIRSNGRLAPSGGLVLPEFTPKKPVPPMSALSLSNPGMV